MLFMTKPLTLVQLLPALDSGGVERATLEVAAEAVQRGHRAIVVAANGRLVPQLIAQGAEHIDWPIGRKSLRSLRWIKPLRTVFADADVIHARSRLPAWLAYRALRGLAPAQRPAWLTTVHGLYSVNRYSAIMTRGDAVIAVSKTVQDYILDNYPATESQRIKLIYNGIDALEFPYGYQPSAAWRSAWQQDYPQTCDRFLLTLPGRLTRRKGHEDFIHLLAGLKKAKQCKPVHGLIVGSAQGREPYLQELRGLLSRLGLVENRDISFTGQRTDVCDIYAVSDLVLSLSTKPEAFGRTVLEPLSLGVPVLAYEHGGVGEILAAMFPQGVVPLADKTALQQRVAAFLQTPPKVIQSAPFARQKMLDETFDLYQQLAESSSKRLC
jgi:glycosyltransferase involved in cell wall biosynthesis